MAVVSSSSARQQLSGAAVPERELCRDLCASGVESVEYSMAVRLSLRRGEARVHRTGARVRTVRHSSAGKGLTAGTRVSHRVRSYAWRRKVIQERLPE